MKALPEDQHGRITVREAKELLAHTYSSVFSFQLADPMLRQTNRKTVMMSFRSIVLTLLWILALFPALTFAQERISRPYFVTYDHYMGELDALEFATVFTLG